MSNARPRDARHFKNAGRLILHRLYFTSVFRMSRTASITRNTAETQIELTLDLDGSGKSEISTGVGFFDHMLTLFAKHGLFDLMSKQPVICMWIIITRLKMSGSAWDDVSTRQSATRRASAATGI